MAADLSDPLFDDYRVLSLGIGSYRNAKVRQDLDPPRRAGGAAPAVGGAAAGPSSAAKDAMALASALAAIGYPPERITCLCDGEATLGAINRQLRALGTMRRAMRQAPLVLLFWAGHGASDRHGQSFLLPHNADPDDLPRTAITVEKVIYLVRSAAAYHQAIFLDTCYAAPHSERLFGPAWRRLDLVNAPPTLTFVGASTYLALDQAGTGGILARCLREALTCGTEADGGRSTAARRPAPSGPAPGDAEGTVHLEDVTAYLQRHLRRRAEAAWREAGLEGDGPAPQTPYILAHPGEPIAAGRNVARHLQSYLDRQPLPATVRELAAMLVERERRRGTWR